MSFSTTIHSAYRKILPYLRKTLFLFFSLSIFSVIFFRFVMIPFTPLMVIRASEHWIKGEKAPFRKDWTSLDNMSVHIPLAVISSEDQLFTRHLGFDPRAIKKAYRDNQKHKKRLKGASTISQQVAKNVFLWPGRSYLRKGLEVYFTVLIELLWSKERIMEVYLNVAEMGNGIYGAEAASQVYFGSSAANLNKHQAAWLACILPNPRRYCPKRPTAYLQKRHAWIIKNMNNLGEVKW